MDVEGEVGEIMNLSEVRLLMSGLIDLVMANMPAIENMRYDVTIKPDGSPVTAADIHIERIVKRYLEDSIPGVVFIGEESFSGSSPVADFKGYFALLDPIDGTENFCSGLKEWGVSFTLWHGFNHVGSLLFMPELNVRLMTGDKLTQIRSRIRGFSSSMCSEILTAMAETRESRLMGCAVYNLYNVIRGSFARFTNPNGAYAWDLLPGLMLALEHNCEIQVEGKPYVGQFLGSDKKYRIDIWHRYDFHTGQGTLN